MSCVASESGLALLARLGARPNMSHIQPQLLQGLKPGEVVEFSGDPGSGKSFLCSHLLTSALLPQTWHGIKLNGCEAQIVFIDSDMTFNILIIENMITRKIKRSLKKCQEILKKKRKSAINDCELSIFTNITEAEMLFRTHKEDLKKKINELVKKCLSNLFYFRCKDSSQYAITLISIDQLLITKPNISMVVIDSISAFYWYDKTYRAENWYKLEQYYNKIFKVFLSYIKENKLILIATRQSLFQKKKIQLGDNEEIDDECSYEYMGKEWTNSVDRKIHLTISNSNQNNDLENSNETRPVYSAEVNYREEKNKVHFEIHEDGLQFKS